MEESKIVGFSIDPGYSKFVYELTNPEKASEKPQALDDVVVLDLSYGSYAGLFASSILAELGAEVIRVEPPEGDIARKMTPYGIMIGDAGLAYLTEARNKFHITLNIKTEEGREILKKLVRKCDVLIETFKPGYMDSLGIGYRQLREINPGLIYCAIHTYGQFGEESERRSQPDYDIIDQARGVVMSITGEPDLDPDIPKEYKRPVKQGNWMGWYVGGAWAAFGILIALFYRRKTGKGQFIDMSPPEGLLAISNYHIQYYHLTKQKMPRAGNFDYAVFPYTYVKCKDGYAFMAGFTDPNWTALCEIMNRPDLRGMFSTIKERLTPENQPKIQKEIEKFTTNYTAAELLQMVMDYSKRPDKKGTVVTGKLNSPKETLNVEHFQLKKMFVKIRDKNYGELLLPSSLFRFMSETPGRIKWACRPIGADNEYIYAKYLGIFKDELERLKSKGVV
jgi:crotonobetainyl-CoA:carnitine CoA-transferase CaiB-like acyl-CoA transferase